MKRIVSILLCVLIGVSMMVPAFAEETPLIIAQGDCGDNAHWKLDNTGKLTIHGEGRMSNYSYGEMGRPSYEAYKDQIKTLSFEGITKIGNYAFYQYAGLTGELQIPSNITEIGDAAFEECTGYTNLCLHEGLQKIGFASFRDCTGFVNGLVFPSTMQVIGLQAFSGCSGFRGTITIPENVTVLGAAAFRDCRGLTGSVVFPANITEIPSSLFWGCSGLDGTIDLGNTITKIGSLAFYNCSSLKGDLRIPDSVTEIESGAFYNCSGLDGTLTLSNQLQSIGDDMYLSGAFERCFNLHGNLILPDTLTKLGKNTFKYCRSLSDTLYIPESLTEIGEDAFHECALNNDLLTFFSDHMEYLMVTPVMNQEPTCTQEGLRNLEVKCADCGSFLKMIPESIPAKGHELALVPTVEATSEQQGIVEHYRCSACGALFFDEAGTCSATPEELTVPYVPPVIMAEEIQLNTDKIELYPGETFQLEATVLPDEATDKTVNWYTEPSGVINVDWNTGLVTALEPGTTFVTCFSHDGPLVMVPVEIKTPVIHVPGDAVYENITVAPTCVDPGCGEIVVYCSDCGMEMSRTTGSIPPTGIHIPDNVQTTDVILPTCSTQGSHTEIVYCSTCGEMLSYETVNDGYGAHVWNDGDVQSGEYDRYTVTDYTCRECGTHKVERTANPNYRFRCDRCDWYDANKDKGGIYGFVIWMIHTITHMVQEINWMT